MTPPRTKTGRTESLVRAGDSRAEQGETKKEPGEAGSAAAA